VPTLPDTISCTVPDYCTAIDCCMDIESLGLSLNAYIDVDLCSYRIAGGIEKKTFNVSLLSYEWGKKSLFSKI